MVNFLFFLQQGEWVWLKRFEAGTTPELRPSCLNLLRKVGPWRLWRAAAERVLSGDPYWYGMIPTQSGSF